MARTWTRDAETWPWPLGVEVNGGPLAIYVVAIPVSVVLPALFPWMRWRRRLGRRGQLRVAAAFTLWRFALSQWALPPLRRAAEDDTRRREQLRDELGREPTQEELFERWAREQAS